MLNAKKVEELLETIQYKQWKFHVGLDGQRMYLQLVWNDICSTSKKIAEQKSRKWFLSEHMTKSEVIQTGFKAVLTAEEHEVRENFLYKGKAIFGPHFDVDALLACAEHLDKRS